MARKYVTVILTTFGLTPTSTNFNIYTDGDNYAYPIAQNISNTELTSTTTPFNILVPPSATKVMILDVNNNKKIYAVIDTNNLCNTCNLGFDYYPTSTVGRLYAGNLTGSCQTDINDYRIYWYGPNSNTNISFASGSGTSFNYRYTHPLIGASGLFVKAGTYFPVIDKVKLGGVAFSQSGNTLYSNNPVPALLTCFNTVSVEVDAFKCDNGGSSNLQQYEHRVLFTAVGSGESPGPLNSTFLLSAGTQYFAWKFKGEAVPDKIKLTYYGFAYNYEPIVLEYWEIGSQLTTNNFGLTTFPKSASTAGYMGKLTCLTGFTINDGDTIIMDVIPNPNNPTTNWDFYFGCFNNTIDCVLDTGTTRPYKIIGSSITGITGTCGTMVKIQYSGVPDSATTQNNLFNFSGSYSIYPSFDNSGESSIIGSSLLYFSQITCTRQYSYYRLSQNYCMPNDVYNITYEKSSGNFKITTNNPSYITDYITDYETNVKPLISSYSADSSNIGYYGYFSMVYPASTGSQVCGDGTVKKSINIHQSSVITTGTSGSDYWINYTMPTITSDMVFSTCDIYCSSSNNQCVFDVNSSSTGTSYNYTGTTNTSARYRYLHETVLVNSSASTTNSTWDSYSLIDLSYFQNETMPASGSSYTIIPSLSGVSCSDLSNYFYKSTPYSYRRFNAYYQYRLIDPLDLSAFQIYADTTIESSLNYSPIVWKLVYTFSGGTIQYSDSNYIL
jgi:hypothetical protein